MDYISFFPSFKRGCISLSSFKVHIIHVGPMSNKGTQGLLKSDISVIKDTIKSNVAFSVSTTDVEGVRRLNLSLDAVLPPMVDIPYEKADLHARKFGFARASWRYKAFAIACLVCMFIQTILSAISVVFVKVGLKAFYRAEVLKHLKDCNIVISSSDENFKETASLLPLNIYWIVTWWSMLVSRTWEVLIANFLCKPVVMFPNSVGPFRTWIGRFLSRLALNNCCCILVREPISYGIVNSLGIKPPKILTSDTTLLFKPTHDTVVNNPSHPVIGVSAGVYSHSLSEKDVYKYIAAHAKALDGAVEKHGFSVVFLPHYVSGFHYDDLEVCELILRQMKNKNRARIVNADTVDEFKSFLDQMDMVISSKMHPAVLATSGYVPTLCIAYDHKQTGFFERLGMIDCVLHIRNVSYQTLSSNIDYVWSRRDEIRVLLKERVSALQKGVRKAIKHAITPFAEVK